MILENNLIKKERPRYNVYLKDDKTYPYLRLDPREEFPRLTVVRRRARDGAHYFGPYTPARAMHKTIRFLGRVFPLRQCREEEFRRRSRPCLNFEVGRCPGPCSDRIGREEYRELVREVVLFLKGRHGKLIRLLEKRMEETAGDLLFEEAAAVRDRLTEMRHFSERQAAHQTVFPSADVIGLAARRPGWAIYVLFIRHGNIVGGTSRHLELAAASEGEILEIFLERFYSVREDIPARVLLPVDAADMDLIEAYLSRRGGRRVRLKVPSRGQGVELLLLARKNALAARVGERRSTDVGDMDPEEAGPILGKSMPRRIEVYDASNIRGKEAVAGMVLWVDGSLDRSGYRRFRIRNASGLDDYAMICEAVRRRLARVRKGEVPPPDLILVDGGAGHLGAAVRERDRAGLEGIRVIGISKGERRRDGDRLHLEDGTAPSLSQSSPLLRFFGRLRDEAHRYSISYHRKRRQAGIKKSFLDGITGVGPRRKAILLNYFGSLEGIGRASLEDLMAVPGLPGEVAGNVFRSLRETGNH